jgi:ATP-dependent DNA helicase DinG
MEIAVPAVSIKLVQMMGRLIRTEDDYGLITLLDRRVLVKRYGQLLLNSLPEYRRQFDGITHAA